MINLFLILIVGMFNGYNRKIESKLSEDCTIHLNTKFTWTNVGPEGGYFVRVAADPQDSNLAILQGILTWITRDGTNWQVLRDGGLNSFITFTGYHRVLLGIRDTLYYSSDGANTFSAIRNTGYIHAMTRVASDTVYLIQDSAGIHYLYRTTDGGLNWTKISPLSYNSFKYITYAPSNPDLIYMAVSIGAYSDSVYVVRSEDGGITWNILSYIGDGIDVTDIEVNPENAAEAFISCGFDGDFGLIYTVDSFQSITNVPGILIPYDVEFLSGDTILVATIIPTGIIRGVRGATGWSFEPVDTLTTCTDIEQSGNVFYVSATTGCLKSVDGGNTFIVNENGLHGTFTYSSKYLSKMINRTVYMPSIQGNALYVTRNGGISWEKIYIPHVAVIFDVEANPQDENIVYLACGAGVQDTSGNLMLFNILHSSDGGQTFIPLDTFTGNPDDYNWIETLHTFSDSLNVLIGMCMVYSDYEDTLKIVRSTDGGHSFPDTTGVFTAPYYEDFAGDNPAFIQADSVIYISSDFGLSFDTLTILNSDMARNLTYYKADSLLFYNTYDYSDSVYALKISDLTLTNYTVPGVYVLQTAQNGGFYALASNQDFLFYAGTYKRPFDSSESIDFFAGAIRASTNEVLLFTYGFGIFRSTDAVAGLKQRPSFSYKKNGAFVLNGNILNIPDLVLYSMVNIYSAIGRLERSYRLKGNTNSNLTFNGLSNGIYFVKLLGKRNKLIKVLKVK